MKGKKVKLGNRQEAQREIAVRRAEHFALSNSTPSGVLPGTVDSQKIAGPFRIANEILTQGKRGRDGAKDTEDGERGKEIRSRPFADVYDKVVSSLEEGITVLKQPRIERERLTGPIDTLQNLCVRRLVDLIDRIDDLEGVHPEDLAKLATALGKARKLDHRAALLVAVPSTEALYLPECSMIEEETLMKAVDQVRGGMKGTAPLHSLRLRNCGHSVSNKAAEKFATFAVCLNKLELSGCYKLGDGALEALLGNCTQLKELNLSTNCKLGTRGVVAISKLATLQGLTLDNCAQLVDADLLPLSQAGGPLFRELSLVGLTFVTDASICSIVERLGAGLNTLRLGGCVLLSDAVVVQIRAACKSLRHLDLGHIESISEAALLSLFIQEPEPVLEHDGLHVHNDGGVEEERGGSEKLVSEPAPVEIIAYSHVGPLVDVTLTNVRSTSDNVIKFLSESCTELQHLNISGCNLLTSKAAICLCTNAKSLASLDVSFVRGISNQAMTYAVDSLPSLKTLVVWGCTQLDFFFNIHSKNDLLVVGRHL